MYTKRVKRFLIK